MLVFYFFRSVSMRGLLATVKLLSAELTLEKKYGIRTSTIKKSNSDKFFHYQGAPYVALLRVFGEIYPLTSGLSFTDIGCGKGRAVFVAEHCGYKRLTGLELDPQLLEEARINQKSYMLKRKDSVISFVHANALEYPYEGVPMLYFLFNPFNEAVLEDVLERICLSTDSETWFVYMNPQYTKPFKIRQMELVREFKTKRYTEALVYKLNHASARS